jgi:hypothetical protein
MNREKFKQLVLYIADRSADDPRFGAVKLNKILYYADFLAYRRLRRAITGDAYQHLSEGPAPKHLLPIREELLLQGLAHIETREYFNAAQRRLVADQRPTPGVLSDDEIGIVDEVIEALWNMNATDVSNLSHEEFGWQLTTEGETIPYSTAWIESNREPLTEEQVAFGQELATRQAAI